MESNISNNGIKNSYKILRTVMGNTSMNSGQTFQLPIYLEEKIDNLGVMSVFDGEIEQVVQYSNFSYSGNGYTLIIYNTTNTNNLKSIIDSEFTINWGDGTNSILKMSNEKGGNLPSISHTYNTLFKIVTLQVTINSPWKVEKLYKTIKLPFINNYGRDEVDSLGTLTYNIPYTTGKTTQNYLVDYRSTTGKTNPTNISFMGVGKSRLKEFTKYGNNGYFGSFIYGSSDLGDYTGYTIDGLLYFDYSDGYTYISGSTNGTKTFPYINEQVYNGMLTREEFLIGFIEEPEIYSDIFIERGKQSIMERNLRLGEIDNIGELEIYGGGYFNVKKQ